MTARLLRVVLADGMRGFVRGRALTAAAVLVIAFAFLIPSLALLSAENLAAMVTTWGRPDVIRVYLDEGSTMAAARDLAARAGEMPGVVSAVALDPDAIDRRFKERFPEMADLPGLLPKNPFPPEVEVEVPSAAGGEARSALLAALDKEAGVAAVLTDDLWTGRLLDLSRDVLRVGQIAGAVFALFAALIVAGVIRLSLLSRAGEIETMSVVGAPRLLIAGPHVVEGLLHGATGSALALGVAFGVHLAARSLAPQGSAGALLGLAPPPLSAALLLVLAAAMAGVLGSGFAVRQLLARLD